MAKFGPEKFAAVTGVSRETLARLTAYADLLTDWNNHHNLVSRSSIGDLWHRHFWDSAQLMPLIPAEARSLVDLGSGAGFPGLVLAAMCPALAVTLYEATTKKCTFLAAAAERMGIVVTVANGRMEDAPAQAFDVVTSRACAPLVTLLGYAHKFAGPNSVCLFLKGQNVESELTEAHKSWKMKDRRSPSLTDPSGTILELTGLTHVRNPTPVPAQNAARLRHRQPKGRRR